ncbi:unnamed protein product [Rotaria magnacalcarata]
MDKRHFHFQDLPVERFRHIFKYLAPHDLLSINGCSRELLTELLNNGRLPQLQNLRVTFSMTHDNIENKLLLPIPLKQAFAPELRHINLKIFAGAAWVLTFFEDLQRYSQLDRMTISSYEGFAD